MYVDCFFNFKLHKYSHPLLSDTLFCLEQVSKSRNMQKLKAMSVTIALEMMRAKWNRPYRYWFVLISMYYYGLMAGIEHDCRQSFIEGCTTLLFFFYLFFFFFFTKPQT